MHGVGMIDKLLHTPEGVRDIYNSECEKKRMLESQMHQILKSYGFKDIQTPTFEFFDIFSKERGTVDSKDMYKFFDRDGNTLALRPDITPSIARCAAKYYREEQLPIRLCYVENTFINNSGYQGKLKESTQLGAELINDNSIDADGQMIALTISCLLKAGLKEFQVEIGQVEFFKGLIEEAEFNEEEAEQLRILIENKNLFGVESLVSSKNISDNLKEVFLKLPELFGNLEILAYAKSITKNTRALKAIERLEGLHEILGHYEFSDYVSFDLGMLSKYNYYTGIIFRAYTYGTGDAIATGGRYDNLVCQFGKDAPAIGVAIVMDQLMLALTRQKIEIKTGVNNTLILYHAAFRKTAIFLAGHFRKDGINVELLAAAEEKDLSEYIEYAKRNGDGGILYLYAEDAIKVVNIETDEVQEAKFADFI